MYGVVRYEDEQCQMVENLEGIEVVKNRLRNLVKSTANQRHYKIYIREAGRTLFYFDSITKHKIENENRQAPF